MSKSSVVKKYDRFLRKEQFAYMIYEHFFATGALHVTNISPAAAKDTRKHLYHRIVLSRHVYREKPGEGVRAASKAKCRWCVLGHRDPDIRQLERSSPTPQTSSVYTFLFVAAVLQREVTLGDLVGIL